MTRSAEAQELFDGWREDFLNAVPPRFRDQTFDTYQTPSSKHKAILRSVLDWCDNVTLDGPGMFLTGPVGTAKTHLAISAAAYLIGEHGWATRYLPVQEYLEKRRDSFGTNASSVSPRRLVESYKVVILDDIGADRPTDWVRDQTLSLIDAAYNARVLLIVTSNLDYSELTDPLGERAVSRLLEITDKIVVNTSDWRHRTHKERKS